MIFKSCFKYFNDLKIYYIDIDIINILLEFTYLDYFSLKNNKKDMEKEEDGNESSDNDSNSKSSIENENVFSIAATMQNYIWRI